jgi:toxin ParE1/3/4
VNVRFLPDARLDFDEALAWYAERRPSLAVQFVAAVDGMIDLIGEHPERYPRWLRRPEYRRAVLTTFPYSVFYRILPDEIEVVAVAHGARDPDYWHRRRGG